MFNDLTIFAMAKKRMDWVAQRQEVISQNIANSDTPGYIPKDLKPQEFKDFRAVLDNTRSSVQQVATNAAHIVPEMGPDPFKVQNTRHTYESSPNGNSVILEEQAAKLGEARSAYDVAASLFQKHMKMIRTAIGSRG